MSDPAPGWWKASDGQWYPPAMHPNYAPPTVLPPSEVEIDGLQDVQDEEEDYAADDESGDDQDHDAEVDDSDGASDDQTYEDADGIEWWCDGDSWNYWREDEWVVFPGQAPSGLIELDTTVPLNLRILPPGYSRAIDGRLYPSGPAPPTTGDESKERQFESTIPAGGWLAIAGGLVLAGGTLLPWITVGLGSVSRNGFQLGQNDSVSADGPTLLVLGILTAVIGLVRLRDSVMPWWLYRSTVVTGGVAGLALWSDWSALQGNVNQIQGAGASAAIGYGYWMCAVGAGVAVVAGFILSEKELWW